MGANVSKVNNEKEMNIDTRNIVTKMVDILTKNRTETYISTTNVNTFRIVNRGTIKGNINLTQTIDMNKAVTVNITDETIQELQTQLNNELSAEVDQSDQTTATGSGGGSGSLFNPFSIFTGKFVTNKQKTSIKRAFETAIESKITKDNMQLIVDTSVNINDGELYNEGTITGDITVNQGIVAVIVATNAINQLFKETNKLMDNNATGVKVNQATKTDVSGAETQAAVVSSLSIFLLCLCCCLLLIFLMSAAGQKAVEAAATRGAAAK